MQTAAHRMQRVRSDLTVSAAKKVWCPECVSGAIFFTCASRSVLLRTEVTVHTPLSRKVFWHEYAKIPRHTSQNSIAAGNLE